MFDWFFLLQSPVQSAIIAVAGTILSVGSVILLDRRKAKRDWSRSASDAEINSRAKLIGDMSSYIGQLQKDLGSVNIQLDELRDREFDQMRTMRADMDALDRRWRHLANNLIFYNQIVVRKLRKFGETVPPFTGFRQFIEEGGIVREEWLDELNKEGET